MRSLQLLVAIVLLTVGAVGQAKIDRADKVHIIQTVLNEASYTDGTGAKVSDIYVLTNEIPNGFRPSGSFSNIVLITPEELSENLKANLAFGYFKIRRFLIKSRSHVEVDFGHCRGGDESYSCRGATWKFRKTGKKWHSTTATGWAKLASFRVMSIKKARKTGPLCILHRASRN